jgi:hypothetical protein
MVGVYTAEALSTPTSLYDQFNCFFLFSLHSSQTQRYMVNCRILTLGLEPTSHTIYTAYFRLKHNNITISSCAKTDVKFYHFIDYQ